MSELRSLVDPAAWPAQDWTGRLGKVRSALDGRTIVVSNPTNIRWLTGFAGSLGWLIVGPSRAVLVTDGRYEDRAADDLDTAGLTDLIDLEVRRARPEILDAVVSAAGNTPGAVLAEDAHLSHAVWGTMAARLTLAPAGNLVTAQRRVKDAGELARMATAASIADRALLAVAPVLAEGPTEADVRDELEYRMRRFGAHGPSYDTIVASGPVFAARPHHRTGGRTIVEDDTVVIDVGALVDDYHSDMTRSFVVGEPTAEQAEMYELVRVAQAAGLAAVRAGLAARDLDAACRNVFVSAGRADWFSHGTGHGVGLEIHEDPFASAVSTDTLVVGDVVTVEPGLYRDGLGGVRIEDLVTVTATGCELLTALPKDAPCLPSPPTI